MTSYKKFYLVFAFLLLLLAIAAFIYQISDIESSGNILWRNYLNKEEVYTTDGIMSGEILANKTSWIDYSNNWSGEILVRKVPQNNILNFTDEYRYAMASKGLHPLNIEHKYLYERYLTMNKYCNTPLTKTNDLHDVGRYRALVSDTSKLLQCAVPKVAYSTSFLEILRPLEGLEEEKYPYPTLWHNLAIEFGINNPELTAARYQTYTKFMIARHPFSRLYSGYNDKFVITFVYGAYSLSGKIIRLNYLSNMTESSIIQMRQELKEGGNKLTSGLSDNTLNSYVD